MSSQSIVCASCSAAVPYGRLSCPSCGELLASVAGAARRVPIERPAAAKRARAARGATATAAVAATAAIPTSTVASATAPAPAAATAFPAAATPAYLPRPARTLPSVLADVAAPIDAAPVTETVTTDDAGWDAPDTTATEPGWTEDASWNPAAPSLIDDVPQWPSERPATPSATPPSAIEEQIQASMSLPYVLQAVSPPAAARAVPTPPPGAAPMAAKPVTMAPGAYVPPVVGIDPAGPPAPARAWAGHAADAPMSDAGARATAAAGALMDAARLPEFIGWLAVAGSAMAAVGFLLPWGASVIGASGIDYFDRWGLAGPFHPIVVLALLGILGLALVRNPIPLWVRVGLPGFGLGALLLGLGWPYLVALPGRGPGVLVVALGAILLIVAGVMALVTDRHAEADQAV